MNIKQQVRRYLADNVMMSEAGAGIADDASFIAKNLLDSTGVLELVDFIEDTFGVKVEDQEIVPQNLDSLNLIQAFVESLAAVEEIDRLPSQQGDDHAFGFDENALRVYVSDSDGRELELTVGGSNASGTAVYARVGDAPHPVLIGRNLEYYASLILDEVRRSAEPSVGDGPVAFRCVVRSVGAG